MTKTLQKGSIVRIRAARTLHDWCVARIVMLSENGESAALDLGEDAVRSSTGGIYLGMLPLLIDYEKETVTGLDGQEFEIEIADQPLSETAVMMGGELAELHAAMRKGAADIVETLGRMAAERESSEEEEDTPSIETLDKRMREMRRRWARNRRSRKTVNQNAHIRSQAIEIGELAPGVEYWIAHNPMWEEWQRMQKEDREGRLPPGFIDRMHCMPGMAEALNGYVAFPKRRSPLRGKRRYEFDHKPAILDYIPVHGGVTYHCKDQTASVYGFDTNHFMSEHLPRTDLKWIAWQCRVLYQGLLLASRLEQDYERAQTNEARSAILQPFIDMIPEQDIPIGAMINVIGGRL